MENISPHFLSLWCLLTIMMHRCRTCVSLLRVPPHSVLEVETASLSVLFFKLLIRLAFVCLSRICRACLKIYICRTQNQMRWLKIVHFLTHPRHWMSTVSGLLLYNNMFCNIWHIISIKCWQFQGLLLAGGTLSNETHVEIFNSW